jgi:hypothetical protein
MQFSNVIYSKHTLLLDVEEGLSKECLDHWPSIFNDAFQPRPTGYLWNEVVQELEANNRKFERSACQYYSFDPPSLPYIALKPRRGYAAAP